MGIYFACGVQCSAVPYNIDFNPQQINPIDHTFICSAMSTYLPNGGAMDQQLGANGHACPVDTLPRLL